MAKKKRGKYKTTVKQYELFQETVREWMSRFGLMGWRADFSHEKEDDARAAVNINFEDRIATFKFSDEWRGEPDDDKIMRSAFHEVCEVLIGKLGFLAKERCTNDDEIGEEMHVIIRILENTVYKEDVGE